MLDWFKISPEAPCTKDSSQVESSYKSLRRQTFIGIVLCYTTFYICRVSLGIIKQPLIDSGLLSAQRLGYISSAIFFVYAFGKFINSFLADYCNIRRTMATGLLISSIINIALGAALLSGISGTPLFVIFLVLWGANGWAQSMGPAPGAVALSRWYPKSTRATFYSIFATTPQIGRAITFIALGYLASRGMWKEVFIVSGAIGIVVSIISLLLIHDHPQAEGLPSIQTLSGEKPAEKDKLSIRGAQKYVLKSPAIWAIALSCAFVYIVQYAFSDWGVLFLQKARDYSIASASSLIGIQSVFAALGVLSSGFISDRFFNHKRLFPAIIAGILACVSLGIFLFAGSVPSWVSGACLLSFSYFLNVLYTLLSGILALDMVPRQATGAAVGIIGFICYSAASLQNIVSGHLIQNALDNGSFLGVKLFWFSAIILATLIPLVIKKIRRS